MEKIIEFRHTNFAYNATNAFNDFNMEIERGEVVTMIGTSGSGKSTLLKMLINKLPNDSVYYNGKNIKQCSIEDLRKNIIVVFDSPLQSYTARDELKAYARKVSIAEREIPARIDELSTVFDIEKILDTPIKELSTEVQSLIKVLRYLMLKPTFIAFDCTLAKLTKSAQKKVFDYIAKNGISCLNVTADLNEALYGSKIFVLDNFVLILEGSTLSVLKTDTLLKRLGFKLPLAVDLSIELNHYDVLKKIYTKNEKLVGALWK